MFLGYSTEEISLNLNSYSQMLWLSCHMAFMTLEIVILVINNNLTVVILLFAIFSASLQVIGVDRTRSQS